MEGRGIGVEKCLSRKREQSEGSKGLFGEIERERSCHQILQVGKTNPRKGRKYDPNKQP